MKTIIGAMSAALALIALSPAQAWANPQHERMKRCNAEAREQALKGDERKAFMSTCLRGRHDGGAAKDAAGASAAAVPAPVPAVASPAAAAGDAPKAAAGSVAPATAVVADKLAVAEGSGDKTREKACNQSATEQSLRGAKRKAFIAECLKG